MTGSPSGRRAPAGAVDGGFGDRVASCVTARRSQLVLGLDPDPARLWPRATELAGGASNPPAALAARAVAAHCSLAIEATAQHCVAVKLQVACFERLGPPGWEALHEAAARARDHGLLVIADAKRGDVDVTAAAYAQAFLGETDTPWGRVPGLGADALTVNPLLGADALAPFIRAAREKGGGLFVLVRTSNPGAEDLQGLAVQGGGSLSERVAGLVAELGAAGVGACGLSDLGAVVGATAGERIATLREHMPQAIFLLPGVGPQGGRIQDLAPAFIPGRAGGLLSASRAIVHASEQAGGDPATAAEDQARRLRELTWELAA